MPRESIRWAARRGALILFLMFHAAGGASAGQVELVSKASVVGDSSGNSLAMSMSADGRYLLFQSEAPNLVPGQVDTNLFDDVFLRDRLTGTTTLISHSPGSPLIASPSDGDYLVLHADISADGRYIAYVSLGSELVPGVTDKKNNADVFLYDRVTDTTTLVSHAPGEPNVPSDGISYGARISDDGNYVVFTQTGAKSPSGFFKDLFVYLYHRPSGTLTQIGRKHASTSTIYDLVFDYPEISADGQYVVFTSLAPDLVPGQTDTNSKLDVFLYQRSTGTLSLVSRASGSTARTADGASNLPTISADGRWIGFVSQGRNLVPGQIETGNNQDVFLFDRISGEMRLVSHTSASTRTAAGAFYYRMSANGRYLAFTTEASNLVPGQVDTNGQSDVFVYDRVSGTTKLVSHNRNSRTATTKDPLRSVSPSLSADGRYIVFESFAVDLVSGQTDTPDTIDVFLYDQVVETTVLVSHTRGSSTTVGNGLSYGDLISADGRVILFDSYASDLAEGQIDPHRFRDTFVYQRGSGEVTSVSRRDPGNPSIAAEGPSSIGDISADGRFVLFRSRANDLVPGQIDKPYYNPELFERTGTWDVFLLDRATGKTRLMTHTTDSPATAIGRSSTISPVLSADGRFAAFSLTGNSHEFFLYDQLADTFLLVNPHPGLPGQSVGRPDAFSLSADGRYLAYACNGCQVVPGLGSLHNYVFLYDRITRTHTLVSHASGSPNTGADDDSQNPKISADGRFVLFESRASNLVASQTGAQVENVFLFDRTTGAVSLISHATASATAGGDAGSTASAISADGRWVLFSSSATNLVPGQTGPERPYALFLHDRASGQTTLVNHAVSSLTQQANAWHGEASISADGRWVVFSSTATDLVTGANDAADTSDVFLYDRTSGLVTLVSQPDGSNRSAGFAPQISADGSRIAFRSNVPTPGFHIYDRSTGTRTMAVQFPTISPFYFGQEQVDNGLRMSADGRQILFTSASPNVAGDFNGNWDVYLFDEAAGPVTVPGCTLFDSRRAANGPALRSNIRRTVAVQGACGVPANAKAVSVQATLRQGSGKGNVRFYPGGVTATPAATLRFEKGQTVTRSLNLPLSSDGKLDLLPFVAGNGTVHVVIEVNGYSR